MKRCCVLICLICSTMGILLSTSSCNSIEVICSTEETLTLVSDSTEMLAVSRADIDLFVNYNLIEFRRMVHPLLVYNGVYYLPLSENLCQALGLDFNLNTETGLSLRVSDFLPYAPLNLTWPEDHPDNDLTADTVTAYIASLPIQVGDEQVDNTSEPFPFLVQDGIYYLPLTDHFAEEILNIFFRFDERRLYNSKHQESDDYRLGLMLRCSIDSDSEKKEQIRLLLLNAQSKLDNSEWITNKSGGEYFTPVIELRVHRPSRTLWKISHYVSAWGKDNPERPEQHWLQLDDKNFTSSDGENWVSATEVIPYFDINFQLPLNELDKPYTCYVVSHDSGHELVFKYYKTASTAEPQYPMFYGSFYTFDILNQSLKKVSSVRHLVDDIVKIGFTSRYSFDSYEIPVP